MTRLIHTIGHSNHEPETLHELLRVNGIELVVDVRSEPYSRYLPQFSKNPLQAGLREAAIGYRLMIALGGRPDDPQMYDAQSHVLYGLVAESQVFQEGLEKLIDLAKNHLVAILCSEENPTECHRRLLVGRVLADRGWQIRHIRRDGSAVTEAELARSLGDARQDGLFEGGEFATWRSIRSVSPRSRPPSSSEH